MISSYFNDSKVKNATIAAFVLFLILSAFYIFQLGGYNTFNWVSNIAGVAFALTATGLAWQLWKNSAKEEVSRQIWGLLALGLLLWSIGEFLWAFYELVLKKPSPYPSLADVSWVLGYIPLFVALYLRFRSYKLSPEMSRWVGLLFSYAIILATAYWTVLKPIIEYTEFEKSVEKFLGVLYPVGDLTIVLGALLIISVLRGGTLSTSWTLIAIGMLVISASDLLFTYADWNELYYPDQTVNPISLLVDLPYVASYLIMALGFYYQARLEKIL